MGDEYPPMWLELMIFFGILAVGMVIGIAIGVGIS